ncbi:MAG: hypothetical protein WCF92_03355 [bacterium]
MKKRKIILITFIGLFAIIGLIFVGVFIAMKLHLTNSVGVIDNKFIQGKGYSTQTNQTLSTLTTGTWSQTTEWQTLKTAISKDANLINGVSAITNVPSRIIITPLVVEQLRLYNSERETFKQFFQPLNILGSQTQFSWGVMGFKELTAKEVEDNLKNTKSPYYLGTQYESLLDFQTTDTTTERFTRLTDAKNHYYSYLYTALYIKEIETQWKNSGFDISNRPEIIATLFNIGFDHSTPNVNPQVGGAEIDINSSKYSFGGLGGDFYLSNELSDLFPKN